MYVMTDEERTAVAEVVNYSWASEERDAEENGMRDDEGHVFFSLNRLQEWLEKTAFPGRES